MKKMMLFTSLLVVLFTSSIISVNAASDTFFSQSVTVAPNAPYTVMQNVDYPNMQSMTTPSTVYLSVNGPRAYLQSRVFNGSQYVLKSTDTFVPSVGNIEIIQNRIGSGSWKISLYAQNPTTGTQYSKFITHWSLSSYI